MAKETPIDISYANRKWIKEEKQLVVDLREKGHGPKKISDITGFPIDQIKFWIYGTRQKKKVKKIKKEVARKNSLKTYYRTKYNNWFTWKAQCYRSTLVKVSKGTGEPKENLPTRIELEKFLIKSNKVCGYCGQELIQENISLDHNLPTARGGKSILNNLVLCCKNCNIAKGSMTGVEYIQLLDCISTWEDGGKYLLGRLKGASRFFGR
jgi:5-methylcytosine-specific restriction endonuclease McrA